MRRGRESGGAAPDPFREAAGIRSFTPLREGLRRFAAWHREYAAAAEGAALALAGG